MHMVADSLGDLGLETSIFEGATCKLITTEETSYQSRVFYTSDDLYPSHVLSDYHYPGLLKDCKVILRCESLEMTTFCKDLRSFWTLWVGSFRMHL
jgi:hypothetical protein